MDYSDVEDDNETFQAKSKEMGTSDLQLAMQLELARQNSLIQHGKRMAPLQMDFPIKSTIYEEDPPSPVHPASRVPGEASTYRSTSARPESPMKHVESLPSTSRPLSLHVSDRVPIGPRSHSPLSSKNLELQHSRFELPSMDEDLASETSHNHHRHTRASSLPHADHPSGIKRSTRQPLFPTGNMESTPKANNNASISVATPIEPLSIKKKTSLRTSAIPVTSPTPVKKIHTRNSPLNRTLQRVVSPRRVSPQVRKAKASSSGTIRSEDFEHMQRLAVSTKEDIESSRRTLKRIKLQSADALKMAISQSNDDPYSRPSSPDKSSRTPQPNIPMTKAAQERLEEMRNLIGRRQDVTPRSRPRSGTVGTPSRTPIVGDTGEFVRQVDSLATEADKDLANALSSQETLQNELARLAAEFKERAVELERARLELQASKRQCELVKSLLADATAEKEIMYEAFNEELDGMYNDANLPDEEAWHALSNDLRQTKEAKNNLSRENSQLKRKLAEVELEKEEWGDLLRAQGLLS